MPPVQPSPGGADHDLARRRRGARLLELGRPREAVPLLSAHLAGHPDDPFTHALLAQAFLATDLPDRALPLAQRAVALAPDDEWHWRLVAAALVSTGRQEDAWHAARTAVSCAPDSWATHTALVFTDIQTGRVGRDTLDSALTAISLAPTEPDTYAAAGCLSLARDDRPGAERSFREALALAPLHRGARRGLAETRLRRGDVAQSVGQFLALLADDPTAAAAGQGVRRAALALLHRVDLILLSAVFVVFVTVIGISLTNDEVAAVVWRILLTAEGPVLVAAVVIAWFVFRRRLGASASRFVRVAPNLTPALTILAVAQGLAVAAGVAVTALGAATWPDGSPATAVAGAIAAGLVAGCLLILRPIAAYAVA